MGARRGGGPNPEKVWRRVGGPEGAEGLRAQTQKKWGEGWGGSEGGGPKVGEGWGPKISRFFFSLPPPFSLFFSLSGRSSRGILVVLLKAGALVCTSGVLWLSCEAPAAPKPPVQGKGGLGKGGPGAVQGKGGGGEGRSMAKGGPGGTNMTKPKP